MNEKKTLHSLADLQSLFPDSAPRRETKTTAKNPLQKLITLHVLLETKGRKGKGVTVINGFHHTEDDLLHLARTLKTRCGAGGTVKDQTVELQGDHREKAAAFFREQGYTVKVRK